MSMNFFFRLFPIGIAPMVLVAALNSFGNTAPPIQWQTSLGGSGRDMAQSIQQTSDSGYIVAGWSDSNDGDITGNHGGSDFWIVKLSPAGIIQWQRSLGGSGGDYVYSVQQTADGGYIAAGSSNSTDGDVGFVQDHLFAETFWIVKLTANGNIEWQKSLGGMFSEAMSIQQTTDGGYIVAGEGSSSSGDALIVKLSPAGDKEWEKSLDDSNYDKAYSIQQTSDGGFVMAGTKNLTSGTGAGDCWIVKLSSMGDIAWEKTYGGSSTDNAYAIRQTTDGGYIFAGSSSSSDGDVSGTPYNYGCWVVKVSDTGKIQWEKSLGNDQAFDLRQTVDGGYIFTGGIESSRFTPSSDIVSSDCWIVKISDSGNIEWEKTIGGTGSENPSAIQQTYDGGYVMAGNSNSNDNDLTSNHGNSDFWIVKLYPDDFNSLLSVHPLRFDTVSVNESKTLPLLISNTRVTPVSIPLIKFIGVNAGAYSLTKNPSEVISSGATDTAQITFHPSAIGPASVTAQIADNAGDTVYLAISGTGRNPSAVRESLRPHAFALSQNYPDPFSTTTTINTMLPSGIAERARLVVYNVLGEQVADLSNQLRRNADVVFNSAGLAAGAYYYVLESSAGLLRRLMFVVR